MDMKSYDSRIKIISGTNRKLTKTLIILQLCIILIQDFLIYTMHFPSVMAYINDVITIFILLLSYKLIFNTLRMRKFKIPLYIILAFTGVCFIGAIVNQVSILLFIYGIRQTFRFYIFIIACISILDLNDVKKIFSLLLKFQILNIILVLYEYLVLGYSGDYLGGIFGTVLSCNVPLNTFLCVISVYAVVNYLGGKGSIINLAWVAISCLAIAGLAELKFFFIEFTIIVLLALILCKPQKKKLIIIISILLFSTVFGLIFLKIIYPLQFEILTNPSKLIYYLTATDYSGAYTVSRTNFVAQIRNFFFKDDIIHNLFGYGLGNCEVSSVSFLTSDFFRYWGLSYNYNWFSSSMRYLETGALGLISYLLFYISIVVSAYRLCKKSVNSNMNNIAIIMSVLTLLTFFYNDATTKYISYLAFFTLALPYISYKSFEKRRKMDEELSLIQGETKIPHIIHYCWFGHGDLNELSKSCINSWKEKLPDYEIKRWDESNFNININSYVKEAYENKRYAFVSDYARLYIIYHYGGIYLDTDIEVIKSFDEIINRSSFFAIEDSGFIATGLGFAAEKKDAIIKKMMDDYSNIHFIENSHVDLTPCPQRNSRILADLGFQYKDEMQIIQNFVCYPSEYFCPKKYLTNTLEVTEQTYTIHHFKASWQNEEEKKENGKRVEFIKKFGYSLGTFLYKFQRKLKKIYNQMNREA